jgi:hypothetical protein
MPVVRHEAADVEALQHNCNAVLNHFMKLVALSVAAAPEPSAMSLLSFVKMPLLVESVAASRQSPNRIRPSVPSPPLYPSVSVL